MPTLLAVISVILGSGVVSAVVTLVVNHRAEKRLASVAELERDLRIADLFVKLMDLANGRGPARLVEPAATAISNHAAFGAQIQDFTEGDPAAMQRLKELIDASVRSEPVGNAAQRAAAGLIFELADKHDFLRTAAREGLLTVKTFVPEVPADEWIARWSTKTD